MQFRLHLPASILPLIIIILCCANAHSQPEGSSYVLHPNQEVKVASLPPPLLPRAANRRCWRRAWQPP